MPSSASARRACVRTSDKPRGVRVPYALPHQPPSTKTGWRGGGVRRANHNSRAVSVWYARERIGQGRGYENSGKDFRVVHFVNTWAILPQPRPFIQAYLSE